MGEIDRRQRLLQNFEKLKALGAQGLLTPEQQQAIGRIESLAQQRGLFQAPAPPPQEPILNVPRDASGREITTEEEAIKPAIDPVTIGLTAPLMGAMQPARAAVSNMPKILSLAQKALTSPTLNAAQVQGAVNRPGGAGATIGEIAGQGAAAALPGGNAMHALARVVLSALGAGAGHAAEQKITTGSVDPGAAALEGAYTGAGQGVEEGIKSGAALVGRHLWGGKKIRQDVAAKELKGAANKVVNPPGKEVTSQAYQQLYDTKVPVHMDYPEGDTNVRQFLNNLSPEEMRSVRRELLKWPVPDEMKGSIRPNSNPGHDILNALMGSPLTGPPGSAPDVVSSIPIGEMDRFRQFLNKRARATRDPKLADLLDDFRMHTDQLNDLAIDDPRTAAYLMQNVPDMTPEKVTGLLNQARQSHAHNLAAEALDDLLSSRGITGYSDDRTGTFMNLHLGHLRNAMESPQTALEENVVARLARTPGAMEEYNKLFERLQRQVQSIDITLPRRRGALGQVRENVARQLGYVLATPEGRQLFEQAIVEGRGRINYNNLATIANLSRRAYEGMQENTIPVAPGTSVGGEPAPDVDSRAAQFFDWLTRTQRVLPGAPATRQP